MKLTKNFSLQEFESKDGAPTPSDVLTNLTELAKNLQVLRDFIKEPIHINSGYRSPEHNKKIGGKPKSFHLKGMASDITAKNLTPVQLEEKIKNLIAVGKMKDGGLKAYAGFVHYDIRGIPATW